MLTNTDLKAIKTIVNDSGMRIRKEFKKEIKDVRKVVKYTRDFLDRQDIRNQKRITRIEENLGLTEI